MITPWLWLGALGPAALAGVGFVAAPNPATPLPRVTRLAGAASLLAVLGAVSIACAVAFRGTLQSPLIGLHGIGVSLYADRLTAVMVCLVAFIGVIVVAYSRTYMEGDPGQKRFTGGLCLTLAAVLLVILSGNLFVFGLAWLATSLGLNRLLLFYSERPAALVAARKKFLASRAGDVCLMAAAILLYQRFGSLEYATIFTQGGAASPGMDAAAVLLTATAMLKSAQCPLHGWLIEVMETPTPVSALLHAGMANDSRVHFNYVDSEALETDPQLLASLSACDGILVPGGFGERGAQPVARHGFAERILPMVRLDGSAGGIGQPLRRRVGVLFRP